MQILGLDMHSDQFILAHFNARGKLCRMYERATSAKSLLEVVEGIPGPRRLIVEESHLAQWVKHVAEAYVDELIICDPKRNDWIAKDDYADDHTSARKLAELDRGGYIKAVRHPDDAGAELRSRFLHYDNLARQTARFKNMLKATFRQVAFLDDESLRTCNARQHLPQALRRCRPLVHPAELASGVEMG